MPFPSPCPHKKIKNPNKPPPPKTRNNFDFQEGVNLRNPTPGPGFGVQLCFSCWTQGGSLALHLAASLTSQPPQGFQAQSLNLFPYVFIS